MPLFVCRRCTTRYALGSPYCPNCTSTAHYMQGEEEDVPTITKAGGPSYGSEGPPEGYVPKQAQSDGELAHSAPASASDLNPAAEVGQDSTPAPDPTPQERYESRTVVELRQLIHARNSHRAEDEQLAVSGNKAELVRRLLDDDQAAEADEDEAGDD